MQIVFTMRESASNEITQILESITAGDKEAVQKLFPLVYDQLRIMARAQMAKQPGQTLQATGLVHELYLRLLEAQQPRWENRRHFFAVAAEAMRQILVDHARRRASLKRAGNQKRITLTDDMGAVQANPDLLLFFDRALSKLQVQDSLMADVVKLRCFAGLTVNETALALDISPRNVDRQWASARAWLSREISQSAK